jgi:hypothetical protein
MQRGKIKQRGVSMTKMQEKKCFFQNGGCDFGDRFPDNVILCSAPRLIWKSCQKTLPAYTEHTQIQRVEFLQLVLKELHYVLKHGDSHDIEALFSELVTDFPDVAESLTFLLNDITAIS